MILDLIPTLSGLYFKRRLIAPKTESSNTAEESLKERSVKLSALQSALLLAIGLQRKTIEEVGQELGLEPNQVLAQFAKITKKMCTVLQQIQRAGVISEMPQTGASRAKEPESTAEPLETVEDELEEAAQQARRELRTRAEQGVNDGADSEKRARQREFINSLDLSK